MEKLDLDKAQQIERLYATPPVYEWELIVNTISFRTKMMYIMLLGSFGVGIMFFLLGFSWLSLVPIVVGSFLTPWFRYLVNSDKRYYYAINQYGMYSTEEQIIPEIAYTIVRYSAWVGCGICLFAAILVGPIAFVGAGGAALLSFQMTNFRSVPYKSQCLFDNAAILKNYRENDYLLRTENSMIPLIIPECKLPRIINVIKQYNDSFEEEFVDLYKGSKFQARPIILEIVR
ncbi:hypothetical protein DA099_15345 [Photobacterium damselae]|uniref:Uncharacterized protein n=1 Tax=Photobacterium damselae TaxID=38293 RepID=A0ACD3SYI9_PHODM|nr:hypothetical protein [Photobacterium damselae]RDL29273.1 hypothetical protein BC461_14520 [Photobacterium damselae]TMX46662.1 hypothetical protein DA099_15345 [Photobacterium damselae]TMX63062.1 hypothetical protein DA090_16745 [Photobacterium damselae]TMX72749.1 hypothetical protein DA092_16355 [Photobacterium damselae]